VGASPPGDCSSRKQPEQQAQATKGRDLSTLASLGALRAHPFEPAWARHAMESLRGRPLRPMIGLARADARGREPAGASQTPALTLFTLAILVNLAAIQLGTRTAIAPKRAADGQRDAGRGEEGRAALAEDWRWSNGTIHLFITNAATRRNSGFMDTRRANPCSLNSRSISSARKFQPSSDVAVALARKPGLPHRCPAASPRRSSSADRH
jgi:hypothetical protein